MSVGMWIFRVTELCEKTLSTARTPSYDLGHALDSRPFHNLHRGVFPE